MKDFLKSIDTPISEYIHRKIKNPKLDRVLSRLNRGEVFGIIVIPSIFMNLEDAWKCFFFTLILAFVNDRIVLVIKKRISRKRPSLKIMGKENNHPDFNHSFPSAHAANSMVVATFLYFQFGVPFFLFLFLFSLFAGIGRLLTLHHFLSDIIGGWILGFLFGILGVLIYSYLIRFSFSF